MEVMIIGGTGVISTAIVDRLMALGHNVTVFNRGQRVKRYKCNPNVILGDKSDYVDFKDKMKDLRFDAVIDMISYNEADAKATLDAFGDRVNHFVFTSTVAVYERPYRGVPVYETHAVYKENTFSYGYFKARMEDYLRQMMQKGYQITIIRPSLTYGIGCKNIGVMRNNYGIIKRIQNKKPIVVFGDGTNPWAWTFSEDIAKAYAGVLCRKNCFGQIYHATSSDHHIWDDLYLEFGKLVGEKPNLVHISTEMLMQASEQTFSHIHYEKMHFGIYDNTKIKNDVPMFQCEYTLDKIVKAIYDWYNTDEKARIIDESLDRLEDSIVEKYNMCKQIFQGLSKNL